MHRPLMTTVCLTALLLLGCGSETPEPGDTAADQTQLQPDEPLGPPANWAPPMLDAEGFETGIDVKALAEAARFAKSLRGG